LNLALDFLFVMGFGWGAWGSAVATVIGQAVSCVAALIYLYIKREEFGFDFKPGSFRADGYCLKFLIKLGLPLALQSCAINLSKMFVSSWVNSYGLIASAVTGVGIKLTQLSTIVTNALQSASTSIIGQSLGAGKPERIRRTVYTALFAGVSFTLLLSVIGILFPRQIFGIFSSDPDVLSMAGSYMTVAFMTFNGFAVRMPMNALIHGVGNGKLSIFVGLMDGIIVRIGLAIILGVSLNMGVKGFWLGHGLAGYTPFFIGGVYFWLGLWKKRIPAPSI
jgi:putative MATE family efflux protein